MEREIGREIRRAIARKEIPGAVALVDWRGEEVYRKAFGHAALEPAKVPMRPDHVFDLASLTKVVAISDYPSH
jgi:CubicO group peptidase (beta-lactamase class C family)